MTGRPAAIVVQSLTRRIALSTPLPEEDAWVLLCIPGGSTDQQVLEWAAQTLPPAAVAELREVIEREADGLRQQGPQGITYRFDEPA
jgi:hypothetical protein